MQLLIIEEQIPLLTIGAAARALACDRQVIHDAVFNGRLPHLRVGDRRMIDPRELVSWARQEKIDVVEADRVSR